MKISNKAIVIILSLLGTVTAAIMVTGNDGTSGAVSKIEIWWIDSLIDGDGSDVTAADVHLLVQSSGDHNIDQLMANQLDVGLA